MSGQPEGEVLVTAAWLRSIITGALQRLAVDDAATVTHPHPDVLTFTTPQGTRVYLTISLQHEGEPS